MLVDQLASQEAANECLDTNYCVHSTLIDFDHDGPVFVVLLFLVVNFFHVFLVVLVFVWLSFTLLLLGQHLLALLPLQELLLLLKLHLKLRLALLFSRVDLVQLVLSCIFA